MQIFCSTCFAGISNRSRRCKNPRKEWQLFCSVHEPTGTHPYGHSYPGCVISLIIICVITFVLVQSSQNTTQTASNCEDFKPEEEKSNPWERDPKFLLIPPWIEKWMEDEYVLDETNLDLKAL